MPGLFEYLERFRSLLGGGLPKDLSTTGYLQVSVKEQASGAGGLTNTELRATPVPVSVTPYSAVLGGSTVWNSSFVIGTGVVLTFLDQPLLYLSAEITGGGFTAGAINFLGNNPVYGLQLETLSLANSWSLAGSTTTTWIFSVQGLSTMTIQITERLQGLGTLTLTPRTASTPNYATPALAKVVDATTLLIDQMSPLTQTAAGRLRVDLEATSRDVGGVTVIDTADRQQRRLQEQLVLEAYEDSTRNLMVTESATSNRMGFEVR